MGRRINSNAATTSSGKHYYCIPRIFKGTASFLYHNNGDGTFTDVTKGTDIAKSMGKGLGVVATDINNDGRMDLFVANDTVQNFLFVNRGPDKDGNWQFEEIALQAEVGFSDNGQPRSGMGVDAADLNNDGWQDLFVANVDQEMFSVYQNTQNEEFSGRGAYEQRGAGDAPAERLGSEVFRLRQRRPDRFDSGQRASGRHDRQLLATGSLPGATAVVSPSGAAGS